MALQSPHPQGALGMFQAILGDPVSDPEEEAFLVFSQAIPSQPLGFIDSKAPSIELSVAGRDLTIRHSRGLLTSVRKDGGGTTGAAVWKVTPLFAEWIASPNFLLDVGYLTPDCVALELGTGVSGIVALTLGAKIKTYIATDQDYVLKLLKQNISDNLPSLPATTAPSSSRKPRSRKTTKYSPASAQAPPNIVTLELDWELDPTSSLSSSNIADASTGLDLIIACDCIYNDALIQPFNSTCAQLCRLRAEDQAAKPTLCVVAQQLRSPDVFESWVKSFHQLFHVWRVPDNLLTPPLRENTGFIIHVGILR